MLVLTVVAHPCFGRSKQSASNNAPRRVAWAEMQELRAKSKTTQRMNQEVMKNVPSSTAYPVGGCRQWHSDPDFLGLSQMLAVRCGY